MKKNLFVFIASFFIVFSYGQVPQGFNYQAVARDQKGEPLKSAGLTISIGILQGGPEGTLVWKEDHAVMTNEFGLFSLIIGDPAASGSGGSLESFDQIDWTLGDYYLQVTLDDGSGTQTYDPVPFLSVPYASVAGEVINGWQQEADTLIYPSGSVAIGTHSPHGSTLAVQGDDVSSDKALFEVKRKDGQTVFAVYNDSIRMYVNAGATKGPRGGFAIGGFGMNKGTTQPLMVITPDSARIYFDQSAGKGPRGGFAIGGLGMNKGNTSQLMYLEKDNYFIGHNSGSQITTGLYNQVFGYEAGMYLTEGMRNVFFGNKSGLNNLNGDDNIFIGDSSGVFNTSGSGNVFIGTVTGKGNRYGNNNIYIGYQSGYTGTGHQNICIGNYSGFSNQSSQNLFIGEYAGEKNTIGNRNSFVGFFAGQHNTTGAQNAYFGQFAGMDNLKSFNTFIGYWSGGNNIDGEQNAFLGYRSGQGNNGSYNVFLGYEAGEGNLGSGNVFVGYQAGAYSGAVSDVLYIDNTKTSSPLIYGDFKNDKLTINDVLRLTPRTSPPDNPQEGELYVGTDHHIYCYLGGGWKQLD